MDRFTPYFVVCGRVLLALMFILSGIDKIENASGTAGYIASVGLPAWPSLAVATGLFEIVAGLAVATGWNARWAALALALFTLTASVLFHNFWSLAPEQQFMQQLLFMKNLSVAGGLLILGAWPVNAQARQDSARPTAR